MQIPRKADEARQLKDAIRALKVSPVFAIVLSWLKAELAKRDEENRVKGQENMSSEAQCLADILRHIDACWAPEANLDEQTSGVEGESAAIGM